MPHAIAQEVNIENTCMSCVHLGHLSQIKQLLIGHAYNQLVPLGYGYSICRLLNMSHSKMTYDLYHRLSWCNKIIRSVEPTKSFTTQDATRDLNLDSS